MQTIKPTYNAAASGIMPTAPTMTGPVNGRRSYPSPF
jgi:hypothetical protein